MRNVRRRDPEMKLTKKDTKKGDKSSESSSLMSSVPVIEIGELQTTVPKELGTMTYHDPYDNQIN